MRNLRLLLVNDPAAQGYIDCGLIEKFAKEYQVSIDYQIVDWENYMHAYDKIVNGTATYDIFMVAGHLWLPQLLQKNIIEPLTIDQSLFPSPIMNEIAHDGKIYLAPSFSDGHLLVYNKGLLEKYDVIIEKSVLSLSDLKTFVQKLHNNGLAYPISMKSHPSEIVLDCLPYLRSQINQLFDEEGQLIVGSDLLDCALTSYKEMLNFVDPENRHLDNEGINKALRMGDTAFAITWNGQLGNLFRHGDIKEDEFGYALIEGSWNVIWSLAIAKSSTLKSEAQDFIHFLMTAKHLEDIGDYSGSPMLKKEKLHLSNHLWYEEHYQLLEIAQPLPSHVNTGKSLEDLYQFISKRVYVEECE